MALGFSASGEPEYVTTQPPLIEIPAPLLVADIWMPSSPSSTGDLDAQPMIQSQGPRSPTVAGVPGGRHSSGPQGFGASSPGGGSPGGGKSGPRNPSSPTASGPTAPPSDPTPGDNGPLVAGPTTTPPNTSNPGPQTASVPDAPANPPASNQPGPVDLPDALTGPVVGANDDPQNKWLSPGNSPGKLEIDGPFTLGEEDTLLFEILGNTPGEGGYDQLIVHGDVEFLGGNIVFAFINGYDPTDELFKLILADGDIIGGNLVNYYYGFFDKQSYPEHAPYDLAEYNVWTEASGVTKNIIGGDTLDGRDRLEVTYVQPDGLPETDKGKGTFDPVDIGAEIPAQRLLLVTAEIPAPAPLLLLATGLLLAGSFRRRA